MKLLPFRKTAFSLTELMVTVAVLGILGSIVIQVSGQEWRRERILAVQVDLVGWLEAVRRAALRNGACQVRFVGSNMTLEPGDTLAEVEDSCLYTLPMTIPGVTSQGTLYTINTNQQEFAFTPPGTVRTSTDLIR